MNYEVKTNKTFDEAVESLKSSLADVSFGVLWELNFKDKLKEKGYDFDSNFKVFEVCDPKQAKEVLETHIEVGYFLPCKVVVYEKDGTTRIGMPKPTQLLGMMGRDELMDVAEKVEGELKKAIDNAAK